MSRIVPVNLIAGKEYVLRNGKQVVVRDNPHWQCAAKFPFIASSGDWLAYFTPTGQADPLGGYHVDDIVHPVYKVGETYAQRTGGDLVKIISDDNEMDNTFVGTYPLNGSNGSCYTPDGRYILQTQESVSDLMDYAVLPIVKFDPQAEVPIPGPKAMGAFTIGSRVYFNWQGMSGVGVIKGQSGNNGDFAVECDHHSNIFHHCGGLCADGHGWYVPGSELLPANEAPLADKVNQVMTPLRPDLPSIPLLDVLPVDPSLVGTVLEVCDGRGNWRTGIVQWEDESRIAVEFPSPNDFMCISLWDCEGHVPSGRGWFVSKVMPESYRVPVFTTCEPVAKRPFDDDDRHAIWDAFRVALGVSPKQTTELDVMERIIAARRRLMDVQ